MNTSLKTPVAIIPLAILVLFLSFLLIANYRSQVRLKNTALSQLVYETETRAVLLGHYFGQRQQDLEDLARSRELSAFYENRALGMSMDYGLKESLVLINLGFERVLSEKAHDNLPLFHKVILLDKDGSTLCERALPGAVCDGDLPWQEILTPKGRKPLVLAQPHGSHTDLLASLPYFFKNTFAGQLIIWLNPAVFFASPEFLLSGTQTRRRFHILLDAGLDVPLFYPAVRAGALDPVLTARPKAPVRHVLEDGDIGISIRVLIPGTPFTLISSQPAVDIAGYTDPSPLLAAMVLVAVFVVGSTGALWRMHARALVLKTRLEQENIRKKEMEEKNITLETEVMISNSLEQSLKESEEKFKTVSMAAQDAIIMVNNDGQISFWNRAATAVFGYSAHEAMDRDFCSILAPEKDRALFMEQFSMLRETGAGRAVGRTVELEVKRRHGEHFPAELSLSAVKLDGKWQAIGIIRDITQRKAAEAEIENHRQNLESLVKERTLALEKAQKELVRKAVDAGRAQLSAMVLHNIGNAITPVCVTTEQLKKSDLTQIVGYLNACYSDLAAHKSDLTAYVTTHERGKKVIEYMGRLIQELEAFDKKHQNTVQSVSAGIEYVAEILSLQGAYAPGRNEIKEWVSLNDLVRDALKIQEGALAKRDIKVELTLHHPSPRIMIEKNKLMQVLINFIKNSCDAIDENKGDIRHFLKVASLQDPEGIVLTIADSGCGVAPEHLGPIFDLGFSTKRSSGFGLYYCRTFIEENNGTLEMESRGRGLGAKIIIGFPLPCDRAIETINSASGPLPLAR